MGTPTNRTPVRIARGTTSALNTGLSDIQEGEIVWDTTLNKLQVKEGNALEDSVTAADATKANIASPTFTGTVTIPSGASISGFAPLASPTFTGAVQNNATVTVGVDDTGHDVKFFGATAGKYIQWDESEDKVIIEGAVDLNGQTNHLAGSEHILMPAGGLLFQHNPGSGAENVLLMHTDYCKLYHDNNLKFETNSGGAKVSGNLEVTNTFQGTYASSSVGEKFKIMRVTASGNPDTVDGRQYTTYYTTMEVANAEDLFVELHEDTIFEIKWNNPNGYANDSMSTTDYGRLASFKPQEGVKLFYNDVKKFETTTSGVKVTGAAVPASITALTDGATIATDLALNNNYSVTLAGNRTLGQPTNQTVGQSGSIFVTQDGTGSRTLAYHADWKWVGGTAPTLTTTAAAVDRIDYIVAAANKIHAVASLDVK